jgi:SAM-dependent methyltransferase
VKTSKWNGAAAKHCPICGSNDIQKWLQAPDRFHARPQLFQLLRCPSCSLVWLDNPPSAEEMPYHYGDVYHDVISSIGEAEILRRWQKQRQVVSELKSGGALLDVGCSSGAFLSTLKNGPWDLYGIEIDAKQASRAREMTGAQIFTGDLFDAPFPAESFDVVTGFHVLEHFDRPQERIQRIFEWLKPGGILYLGLPNIASWEARLFGSYWFGLEMPRHLYHYSPSFLRKLITSAGFHEVWLKTPGTYSGHSILYLFDDIVHKIGLTPKLPAVGSAPRPSMNVLLKGYRVALGTPLAKIAELSLAGANIEAVFQK